MGHGGTKVQALPFSGTGAGASSEELFEVMDISDIYIYIISYSREGVELSYQMVWFEFCYYWDLTGVMLFVVK